MNPIKIKYQLFDTNIFSMLIIYYDKYYSRFINIIKY
jgi:hypothetical protein